MPEGRTLAFLQKPGLLLAPLRDDQAFFERFFIDAGALCLPLGLELSSAGLRE